MSGTDALFNLVCLDVLKVKRHFLMKLGDIAHATSAVDYADATLKTDLETRSNADGVRAARGRLLATGEPSLLLTRGYIN